MKNKISVIVIVLLELLTPWSFAQTKAESSAVVDAKQSVLPIKTAARRGTFYRVRHKGNTSYLFGTIHVGKADFYPLAPEVEHALSIASKIAVELDTHLTQALMTAMQKHGMYGVNDSLKNHLSQDTLAQLKPALEAVKIPLESVMQMKPWLVADLLLAQDIERAGYDQNQGIEEHLLKSARENNKQVVELEGADFQFSLFNALSEQQQGQFLDEVLVEIKNGKVRKDTDELANAWSHADAKELTRLMDEMLSEKTMSAEFTQRVLLDQRNPVMAEKIEGLLQHDKVTFVGVGLLHLIGEKSVPALLRQRGYAVERMY